MKKNVHVDDFTRPGGQVTELDPAEFMPLPPPYDKMEKPPIKKLTDDQRKRMDASLDGVVAIGLAPPATPEEEKAFIEKFLAGLEKLFSADDNWTFLQPLMHTLEYCVKCQICSDACPVYVASGRQDIYRPTMRPELLRRIVSKYIKKEHPAPAEDQGQRHRPQLADPRPPGGAGLSLHPLPPLRPGLPARLRQRPGEPRDPQGLQPGDGDRPQGAPREGIRPAAPGRLLARA